MDKNDKLFVLLHFQIKYYPLDIQKNDKFIQEWVIKKAKVKGGKEAKKRLAQKRKKRQNREFLDFINKGGCPSLV